MVEDATGIAHIVETGIGDETGGRVDYATSSTPQLGPLKRDSIPSPNCTSAGDGD